MKEIEYQSILAKDIQAGDILSLEIDPLDVEDCLVKEVSKTKSLSGERTFLLAVESSRGVIKWEVPFFILSWEKKV